MTAFSFRIDGEPGWKQRARCSCVRGIPRMYTPNPTVKWERRVRARAIRVFATPVEGAVAVRVHFDIPVPQSWPKKRRADALLGYTRPTSRPDLDNQIKAILDALNGVAFADDTQITDLIATRRYAVNPGVTVHVAPAIRQADAVRSVA